MHGIKVSYEKYIAKLYRPSLKEKFGDSFIYLDKNEPPFSAFDIINNPITDDVIKSLRTYPNPYKLYKKLAKFVNIEINQLLITQGSEQAIDFIFRIFLDKEDEVVYPYPSFAMFDVFAYQRQASIRHIKFDKNMVLSIETIIDSITSKTKLFVLANPNNPTGTSFNLRELEEIAIHTKKTNTIFLLDEAYFHFYSIESLSLIEKYSNVIITRTFSKALGIAGARVGYVISNRNHIELLRKLKPIDEINQLSNIITKEVIDNAEKILEKNINQVNKWKNTFKKENLKNIKYIDTEGNFILLKSSIYKTHKVQFLSNKILPKMDFSQEYLKDCFRFSITDDKIMNKIISLLKV